MELGARERGWSLHGRGKVVSEKQKHCSIYLCDAGILPIITCGVSDGHMARQTCCWPWVLISHTHTHTSQAKKKAEMEKLARNVKL